MHNVLKDESVLKSCKIYSMLAGQNKEHISFHTPGHKANGPDITELSYSDNLACPRGCIAEAEKDIAEILGAAKSFILTDGSTCGVLSMLYAAKLLGVEKVAVCEASHKSLWNGCKLLGITPLVYPQKTRDKIPFGYTVSALKTEFSEILREADALFVTSPDYYGNVADWRALREYCDENGKLLLADGAHGGHLHFEKELYAGAYADVWVDGVHKSLPAFTQGAIVSARTERITEALRAGVDIFRTTSPSYPVMASVEYAVKYPRNTRLEASAKAFEESCRRICFGGDWTKLCAVFGENAFAAEKELENKGIYAEFCDGNVVMFYLSPATSLHDFEKLRAELASLFEKYPLRAEGNGDNCDPAPLVLVKNGETEEVAITESKGRICARMCGLFPPCTPLLRVGERIAEEKIRLLERADNVFGVTNGKLTVFKE